jgi:hypothetical protein
MKKLGLAIVLVGMLLAREAGAQTINVWGSGTVSCGTWVTNRSNNPDMVFMEFSWVQGFITGLNAGLPIESSNNGHVGAHLDTNAAQVWLDNYCQAHPLDELSDASLALYFYARSQKK